MILRILSSLVLCSFTSVILLGKDPYFHTTKPAKGEGIYALLRKFDLNNHSCNLDKFLELNDLSRDENLINGKEYKLPIFIYTYNDKSIRTTIKDDDFEKAVRIKKYNEGIKAKGLRRSTYLRSKILWVPYHEIGCSGASPIKINKTEEVASNVIDKNSLYVSLFGKKYSEVKIHDYKLKDKVYYIVAGHGGPDPGARCLNCPSTLCEDEYAYDISLRLARDLMQHGAKVHVIIQDADDGIRDEPNLKCDKDETCMGKHKIPLRQKARLVQRSAEINKLFRSYRKKGIKDKNQIAVFLHVDSNNESKSQDVYFYHHKTSKSGKKLAKKIRDTFKAKYNKYQRGRGYKGTVKPRGLFVLNYTQPTAVFVELANIRNKNDHRRLKLHENRQAVANWLYEGLTD